MKENKIIKYHEICKKSKRILRKIVLIEGVNTNTSVLKQNISKYKSSIAKLVEKKYEKIIDRKLQHFGKFIESNANTINEEKLLNYIHCNDERIHKKELIHDKNNKYCSLINKTKKSNDFDNNMEKLDKLTILNMGARYELLNANKMMMYLDLGFVLLNLIIEFILKNVCNRIKGIL